MDYILESDYGYYAGRDKKHQKVFGTTDDKKLAKRFSKASATKKADALGKAGWQFHMVEVKNEKRILCKID